MNKIIESLLSLFAALYLFCFCCGAVRSPAPPTDFKDTPAPETDAWHQCRMTWTYPTDKTVIGVRIYVTIDGKQTATFDAHWATAVVIEQLDDHTTYYFLAVSYTKDGIESRATPILKWHAPSKSAIDSKT